MVSLLVSSTTYKDRSPVYSKMTSPYWMMLRKCILTRFRLSTIFNVIWHAITHAMSQQWHVWWASLSTILYVRNGIKLTGNPLSARNPGFLLHLVETLPPSVNGLIFRNPCRSWILDAGNVPCTHVADYASELDPSSSVTHIPWLLVTQGVARCDVPPRQVVTTVNRKCNIYSLSTQHYKVSF